MYSSCRLLILAGLLASGPTLFGLGQDSTCTPIAKLRATPRIEAAKRPAVRVRGIVSLVGEGLASPKDALFPSSICIEDGSSGIWVNLGQARREKVWLGDDNDLLSLREGLEIELEGLLDPGAFAPIILPSRVRLLGEKPLPPARVASLERLMRGAEVVQRVRVSGVVQSIVDENGRRWLLKVETGLGHILTRLPKTDTFAPARLLDAEVEMTGLAAASRNWRSEFICPRLIISHEHDLVISKSPPVDPFETQKVPLNALDGFSIEGRPLHRRRIEGTLTYHEPGASMYLQDGNCAVRVESTSDVEVAIGDRVEAAGFIDASRSVAGLSGAVIRKLASGQPPAPAILTTKEFSEAYDRLGNGQLDRFPGFDGLLVTMKGRLLRLHRSSPDGKLLLELECGDSITTAFLAGGTDQWLPGSEIHATGIANVHYAPTGQTANYAKPIRIDLLLRDGRDIVVSVAPSWWTRQRMFTALLMVGAVAIVGLAWAVALRRTIARQTHNLAILMRGRRDAAVEFQAALRERTRLAANLHDTLLQSMTGIAYQIEACDSESLPLPQRKANHLATARRMVQRALEDLRNAVWALRALPLNESTFIESVRSVLKQNSAGHDVEIIVENTNELPLLADFIAGNLLLIVQEAVHNAIRHARPRHIHVTLTSLDDGHRISLGVLDDGSGFALGSQPNCNSGHFGLEGMRERAERLGGRLEVQSELGKGTRIRAEIPILEFDPDLI